jgi:hypothetical protein
MNIRCPQCKRMFEFDPATGPARCTYEDCGWEFKRPAAQPAAETAVDTQPEVVPVTELTVREATELVQSPRHSQVQRRPVSAPVHTMRCPACRSMIPDDSVTCPVCEVHLDEALSRQEGVRAVFDVSGDITFTPRMVIVLFISTLAAFLAFTWIISGKNKHEDLAPIVLTAPNAGEAAGEHVKGLQGVEFAQLKHEFLDSRLTDVRKQALVKQFTGERVIWNGMVTSVEQEGEKTRIEVVMGDPDDHGYVTIQALPHEANENKILQLRRGDKVMFSGAIQTFHNGGAYDPLDFFRIELNNGLLLN